VDADLSIGSVVANVRTRFTLGSLDAFDSFASGGHIYAGGFVANTRTRFTLRAQEAAPDSWEVSGDEYGAAGVTAVRTRFHLISES
jgi:hypothetical protein